MKIKKEKGFTLAELLIVVAIIAVLVAICVPVFADQLEKSREARDLSEIRASIEAVSEAYLTGDAVTEPPEGDDKYSKVYYDETGGYYEIYQKIVQSKDGWQNHVDADGKAAEYITMAKERLYAEPSTSKAWKIRFYTDQSYSFDCVTE